MQKLFLFSIIFIGIVAGIIVADVFLFDDQGNPIYEYHYILDRDVSCDLHWLRPRIHYEMGLFPNYISYIHPSLDIGFAQELDRGQLDFLGDMVMNRTSEVCNRPNNIYVEYIINLNPDNFNTNVGAVTSKKPFYYSDGVNVSIFILNDTNVFERGLIRNQIQNMWTEKVNVVNVSL